MTENGNDIMEMQGAIKNLPIYDLSHVKDAGELDHVTSIENVGLIIASAEAMPALARISQKNVGGVYKCPKGENRDLKLIAGQTTVGGFAFADETQLVALTGHIVVTPPVGDVKCKLIVAGQVFIPEEARDKFSAAIVFTAGQVVYYKGNKVYSVMSPQTFDAGFFEALSEPVVLLCFGPVTITDDVSLELFKSKVTDMAIYGPLTVPKHLKSTVQAIACAAFGPISTGEDE